MNTKWKQNGNGLLFYPGYEGPVPSLRLYVLRDGIEDYEYLSILKNKIGAARKKGVDKEKIEAAERLLTIDKSIVSSMNLYTKDPGVIEARRRDIAGAIVALDKAPEKGGEETHVQ